ncbi:hypothetical protein [Amycolatopsis sp. lyj-346]|uniref:hypothetical protein n=1 Tax=Amycolatopsis sp. lyj-346 TaxID=2789289 RepID=UPI003978D42C
MDAGRRTGGIMLAAATSLALVASTGFVLLSGAPSAQAATTGPCDICASGGTP